MQVVKNNIFINRGSHLLKLKTMNTTIIAIHNSESLYEGIATTVNELLAMDSIKDSDIISNHENSFFDDSSYKVLTIKLPTPYADDEDNYPVQDILWEDLLHTLFLLLKVAVPDSENCHLFIYNDNTTETLELHHNDETITIMYHINNQN